LPLLLYQNGLLSIVALPANALTLIVVPFAMIGSGVAAIAGMALGTWGTVFAFPAHVLLAYIVAVAETLARIPFAAVSIPAFSAWWLVAAYATMAGVYMYVVRADARSGVAHAEGHTK
jgi:membrane-bound ClpP family serine protease